MTTLGRDATVADVVRLALSSSVDRLLEHEQGVVAGSDPEQVHQARVATRRMRSDLRTFQDFLDPDWANELRAELQWLGRELGEVRDIEVMLDRLRNDARALPDAHHEQAEHVVRRLVADWHGARRHIVDALADERFRALRDRLIAAAGHARVTPWAHLRATEALPPVVRKPWKKLRSAVEELDDDPPDAALHEIRIRAKRARYAAEAVAPVFGKPARRYARAIEAIQTVLGDHQDAVVAAEWLAKTATECDHEEAFAAGMLAAREAEAARAARAEFPDTWRAARREKLRAWM
jgi:CHAD domain-containing protein